MSGAARHSAEGIGAWALIGWHRASAIISGKGPATPLTARLRAPQILGNPAARRPGGVRIVSAATSCEGPAANMMVRSRSGFRRQVGLLICHHAHPHLARDPLSLRRADERRDPDATADAAQS